MLRKFDLRSVRTDHMESHRTLFAWVKMQCSVLDDFVGLWKERYTNTETAVHGHGDSGTRTPDRIIAVRSIKLKFPKLVSSPSSTNLPSLMKFRPTGVVPHMGEMYSYCNAAYFFFIHYSSLATSRTGRTCWPILTHDVSFDVAGVRIYLWGFKMLLLKNLAVIFPFFCQRQFPIDFHSTDKNLQ